MVETVIIGAGPYGLSIAAHLRNRGIPFRIFGRPMDSWGSHMPRGMFLKSDGFASNIYDPKGEFTLKQYCAERGINYADLGSPVALEAFTKYIELNAKFHSALIELSRSKILKRAIKQACSLPFASPSAFLLKQSEGSPDLFFIALDQHRGIIEAITNRESMRAELLSREHARLARRNLDVALDNRELLESVRGAKLIQI